MNKTNWFKFYFSIENQTLLDVLKYLQFGEIKIIVHQGKPIKIYAGKEFRLNIKSDVEELKKVFNNRG